MSLLLKNALVVDLHSPYHKKKTDIFIKNGVIEAFKRVKASREIDVDGNIVTPGWMDLNAHFCDPGLEYKEDIESGMAAAIAGGFTDVNLLPQTLPPISSKSDVEYIKNKQSKSLDLHVSAAVSEGLKGENLTEMFDLSQAGALSFSNGDFSISNTKLLLKALQYSSQLGQPIFQNPRDIDLSSGSQMHEGIISTSLGLKGEPSLSEEITIARDLDILEYAGGNLHFSMVSTAKGLGLIRKAKKSGLKVTCDVSILHLLFTDQSIGEFDSNFKSLPPFRTEKDRKSLIKGILDGTVDAICSGHRPQDTDSKKLEFDFAEPGSITLQTFYSCLNTISENVPFEVLIDKVSNGPREILGLEKISISEGTTSKLTVLEPESSWIFDHQSNKSKSSNSPFWNDSMKGKVFATINRGQVSIN